MSFTEDINTLRQLIALDEEALAVLQEKEREIVEHVPPIGFRAATSRERVMSEARVIEERLHENRKRLAVLMVERG